VLAAVALAALRLHRSRPYLAVGWLWFLGTLVPVLGIVQVGLQARADRYTYVPLVGLSIAFAWGAVDLARAVRVPRRALAAAAFVSLAALCVATRLQLRHWRDTVALFERAVAMAPDSAIANHHLPRARERRARPRRSPPPRLRDPGRRRVCRARAGLAVPTSSSRHGVDRERLDALRPSPASPSRRASSPACSRADPERDPAGRFASPSRPASAWPPDADLLELLAVVYASAGRRGRAASHRGGDDPGRDRRRRRAARGSANSPPLRRKPR
jgi:hypothetical protein